MGRPPLIRNTDYEDIVERSLAAGWSSNSISMYLANRFGHQVEASTIRRHRLSNWNKIVEKYPDLVHEGEQRVFVEAHQASDEFVDVLRSLGEMIRIQRERIEMMLGRERDMTFLTPETRKEIEVFGKLVDSYHAKLQDWGVAPVAGMEMHLTVRPEAAIEAESRPIIDLLDREERDTVIELSRTLHRRVLGAG